jgi:hypothetical protein
MCLGLGAEPTFHPAPRLATTPAELAQIKARADFAQRRDQAVRGAEAILKKGVVVPAGWGNWSFYYACPDDGSPLRARNDAEHECPRCKKVHRDERTVASYRTLQHDRANDAALQLAWAHAYTGEPRYAAEVRRILLKLAGDYKTYPQRRDRWGREGIFALLGGRRYSQSLDEAVGVIKLAKAYDLTRAAGVWSDDDRTHVERGFFKPTADTLLVANWDINNHQTWYNAGLMAIASVLEDKALVHKVLTMRGGFHDQLKRSLGRDGVWYEGTVAYHNYALQAMIEIVDAGRRMGLPLHQEPAFRRLLEAPLAMTYPNGQFPAMNDSDQAHITSFAGAFRWAWETYREERFAQALARGDAKALQALLGPEARPKPYLDTQSRVLEDIGLAILRRGEGADAACVMMDYGPHGGSHGHFDKLNIVVYAAGQEWLLDPGRLTYSHKEYKTWVKHTAAHNTVTLGGRSQSATTGKLLWFKTTEAYAACAAESTEAYAGATLRRSLLLMDGVLVDVFDVAAPQATQIDWFAHALGKSVEPSVDLGPAETATLGNEDGYAHLTAARAWTSGPSSWDFVTGPKRLRVWLAGLPREQLITCLGIGYTIDQKVPCLVRRVRARQARFAAAYDLTGAATHITTFTAEPGGALTLATRRGTMRFRFTPEGVAFDTSR